MELLRQLFDTGRSYREGAVGKYLYLTDLDYFFTNNWKRARPVFMFHYEIILIISYHLCIVVSQITVR